MSPPPQTLADEQLRIRLTVNGEDHELQITPRTQLAEVLRDKLHLTGTHLGCEQGVCGACTVMIDGTPQRSCIRFAGSCDGTRIETIEGFRGDALMDRLRDAFSHRHALQCGFCTPGMLATARDIVERLPDADRSRIRHELSGNLCRCTGYVGIVEAIEDVIKARNATDPKLIDASPQPSAPTVKAAGFPTFEPQDAKNALATARPEQSGTGVRQDGAKTVVSRALVLDHPEDAVWAHFSDLRKVVACLPGAEISRLDTSGFDGTIALAFGPISARFSGTGSAAFDQGARQGKIEGRGNDRAGGSNLTGALEFTVKTLEGDPGRTQVEIDLRYALEGRLAQFNRPELVEGFADYILGVFVSNTDAVLSGKEATAGAGGLRLGSLLMAIVRGWVARLFGSRR
jgi:carbon-monoxide dehydrogenase small subunit